MLQSTTLSLFKENIRQNQDLITEKGALVPVIKEFLADMDTPVSLFRKIHENAAFSNCFIFESADSSSDSSRYSFIGFNPFLKLKIDNDIAELSVLDSSFERIETDTKNKNPLDVLATLLESISIVHPPDLPRLLSGAIGFLGYDSIRLVEDIPFNVRKDQDLPTGVLCFYNKLIVFDNYKKTMMLVYAPFVQSDSAIETIYHDAKSKLDELSGIINKNFSDSFSPKFKEVSWDSNLNKEMFSEIVQKAKDYITAGDIFQVVLSQRFNTQYEGNSFDIYRVLRIINPSPYLYFIDFNDVCVIGSSPELLVRIEGDEVFTRPIAGTRPRGQDSEEDSDLEKELMADKKELAEHLMLVDLGRNDLGRVCDFGSVHVTRMMKVERYSHVMHIVSDVKGKLQKGKNQVEALYAAFPAGTLSGAPKIRAMEIIDELEPTERAIYGGTIGYFDFGGNMDWCIAIRTIVLKNNQLTIQAGAGIVADSVPENEYMETMNKAQALKTAVEWSGKK